MKPIRIASKLHRSQQKNGDKHFQALYANWQENKEIFKWNDTVVYSTKEHQKDNKLVKQTSKFQTPCCIDANKKYNMIDVIERIYMWFFFSSWFRQWHWHNNLVIARKVVFNSTNQFNKSIQFSQKAVRINTRYITTNVAQKPKF